MLGWVIYQGQNKNDEIKGWIEDCRNEISLILQMGSKMLNQTHESWNIWHYKCIPL